MGLKGMLANLCCSPEKKVRNERERNSWFERKVSDLEVAVNEWKRKEMLQREKECEEKVKLDKREKMMEMEKVRAEVLGRKERRLSFSSDVRKLWWCFDYCSGSRYILYIIHICEV